MKFLRILFCAIVLPLLCSCGKKAPDADQPKVLHTCINKILTALDPALAADTVSQFMTASFYDTPLQYVYDGGPYRLEPSMLKTMPVSADSTVFECELRDDLYFQPNPCFPGKDRQIRKVTAKDAVFSILRLADIRVKSTGFWLIRGKIKGLETFREKTRRAAPDDFSAYDSGCEGLKVLDDRRFVITLNSPDPRFIYALAMPYFSIVSRKAVEFWKDRFADHPAGSGPFILTSWKKDYQIRMRKNPEYRPEKSGEKLPRLDEIICSFIKQPLAAWLLFLQGELDYFALDGENFAAVVNDRLELSSTLLKRGIRLSRAPEFQTNYIGFNFTDPVLGKNLNLRRAVSLAFDKEKRKKFFTGRIEPAYGPVPPGIDAYLDKPGPYGKRDIPLAKKLLAQAGYPNGIDPATGKPLVLTFDQAGSDTFYRQTAELLAIDLKEIGIEVKPEFSNRARFLQKLRQGQTQLFRFSWTGDYPDAENFLQLFYGPNAGSSNRVCCDFPEFNRMYREIQGMADSPERKAKYKAMAQWIADQCPWIFESHTVAFMLTHRWLKHYLMHEFAFNRWKYLSVDPVLREKQKNSFTPLSMKELRN